MHCSPSTCSTTLTSGMPSRSTVQSATPILQSQPIHPEQIVRRFFRLAFTVFVFAEESPGSDRVVHPPASAHIVRFPFVKSSVAHNLEDVRSAATLGVDALKRWCAGHIEPPGVTWKRFMFLVDSPLGLLDFVLQG
ncbi:hypothetical protein ASPBRDRAFT_31248 [Aspergillus brasiliensis CBS 101740]|uniref:Uncharacterized protein n=1 Tax=Aspergillus brasiliensis (strain CBS 101740 / IMI 381727 / IBT 21946) TaxID=767769 RepID=A0A1L9UFA4_ASPBC|nr:hypothetical protein ASPBRDRAFT_31248 [Aspergillus brasiliensis CBS 101740]